MARQRKPSSLKKGNSENKSQLAEREAIERQLMGNSDDVKSIPEYLSEEEKIYYKWLTEEIEICGIITNLDKPLLEQTANCLWVMHKCDAHIRANGVLISKSDRFGLIEEKENPSIKIKLAYQSKYASLCNQLGLSPAARASLAGKKAEAKEQENDVLLQILKGGA